MAVAASSPHAAGPGARLSEDARSASRSSWDSRPSAGAAHRSAAPPRQAPGRENGEDDWSAPRDTPRTLALRWWPGASGAPTPRPWTSTRSPTPQPARETPIIHDTTNDHLPPHAVSYGLYGAALRASLEVVSVNTHSLSVGPDLPTRRSERPWARQLGRRTRVAASVRSSACASATGSSRLSRSPRCTAGAIFIPSTCADRTLAGPISFSVGPPSC
jgi:hypothetical protein